MPSDGRLMRLPRKPAMRHLSASSSTSRPDLQQCVTIAKFSRTVGKEVDDGGVAWDVGHEPGVAQLPVERRAVDGGASGRSRLVDAHERALGERQGTIGGWRARIACVF